MTEILVAPVASALKLKEELEKEKALRKDLEEELKKAKQHYTEEMKKKDEQLTKIYGLQHERTKEEHSDEKVLSTKGKMSLKESCLKALTVTIGALGEDAEAIPGYMNEINNIINNPTFTILQEEEGARPSRSSLGKGVMRKCVLYPDITSFHGTGYLRWVVGDTTHYLCGSDGCIKKVKTECLENLLGKGHSNWPKSSRTYVGAPLYYGLKLILSA